MDSGDIGALVKSIDEKLKTRADADLKNHSLTLVQSFVLTYLSSRDGQATQKEIEDFLDISHPAVVGIVSRMEQNHHVTTWMDPNNRRNKIVRLTAKSHALSDTMEQLRSHWEERMLRGFSPEEKELLIRLLSRINQNLTDA